VPRLAPYDPELVSDGANGRPPPSALDAPGGDLPADDPAVHALAAQLARQKPAADGSAPAGLDAWRVLARTDDEALFGLGRPPRLVTISMSRDAKRDTWSSRVTSGGKPLRSTRDGIRASGWRTDPSRDPEPRDTILRVLVTEQTRAGGKRAHGRLLAPDIHLTDDELILTMYVTPLKGIKMAASTPETVARVAVPVALGQRTLVDGALYETYS
jgi:hypothetical protein